MTKSLDRAIELRQGKRGRTGQQSIVVHCQELRTIEPRHDDRSQWHVVWSSERQTEMRQGNGAERRSNTGQRSRVAHGSERRQVNGAKWHMVTN